MEYTPLETVKELWKLEQEERLRITRQDKRINLYLAIGCTLSMLGLLFMFFDMNC